MIRVPRTKSGNKNFTVLHQNWQLGYIFWWILVEIFFFPFCPHQETMNLTSTNLTSNATLIAQRKWTTLNQTVVTNTYILVVLFVVFGSKCLIQSVNSVSMCALRSQTHELSFSFSSPHLFLSFSLSVPSLSNFSQSSTVVAPTYTKLDLPKELLQTWYHLTPASSHGYDIR